MQLIQEAGWRCWRGMTWLLALACSGLTALRTNKVVRRRAGIVVAALLVSSYAVGVLGHVILTPEIGIRCVFAPVASHFYPAFRCPEEQSPLESGDRILQVGYEPVENNWPRLLRVLAHASRQPAQPIDPDAFATEDKRAQLRWPVVEVDGQKVVRVLYARLGEETKSVWCRVGPPLPETLLPSLLWFLLKSGLFAVGVLVFWKRPEDRSAGQFFLLCMISLGAYIGGYHWSQILTQPLLLLVFVVCSMLLPAVILHFYLLFPRPKSFMEQKPWWPLLVIYGPPLVFAILIFSGYLHVRWLSLAGGEQNQEALHLLLGEILLQIYLYFGVAAVYYLASVVCLLHSYGTAVNAVERNQVRWILLGAAAALVPIGWSFYLAFWQRDQFAAGAATWPMFAASVCITIAYVVSITRYRLMQLDQLISSGMVYFLISSLAGLIYYGLVFAGMLLLGSRVGEGPSLGQALTVSTTALVLLLLLDMVRTRLKSALDRHYRREKLQLDRTLLRMSQAVEQLVDPPALARRLLHTAAELLVVARGAVYLRQGDPPLYRLANALGPTPALTELSSGCPLVEALQRAGSVSDGQGTPSLTLPARSRTVAAEPALRQLQFLGGEVATALVHEEQLLGLLVLGSRESSAYTAEDVNLLKAFAQLTVLALVSAEGHRTIQTLNRELQTKVEKIAEQQRRILALQSQLTQKTEGRSLPACPAGEGVRRLESGSLAAELLHLPGKPAGVAAGPGGLVGSSSRIRDLLHLLRKVAASGSAVLLRGESGTGKEVLARILHENSPRAGQAFVKVHCAALAPGLLESELFGHVKGAFTNAIRDKVGRFEAADGGTLFLDEIGDINLEVQTKLLRVLQEMTFERVGSCEPVKVDVRILAATHQDLEDLMKQGRFREDLFYRLNVFPVSVPPLREHVEDVPELALHFLRLYGQRGGKELTGIDDDALAQLKGFSWPGNIRQLENVIERAVVIADGPVITVRELPAELLGQPEPPLAQDQPDETWLTPAAVNGSAGSARTLSDLSTLVQSERVERDRREREMLVRALAAAAGNKAEVARALGMARSTLISRLKRLGLG